VRVIGNDLDVTERKHAEAEREHAHQQLEEQAAQLEMQAEELQATAARLEEQVREAERARAAAATSEARYRSLFSSIDEGLCVVEVLFDDRGDPVDYRFVEVNPAFVEQTGLVDAVGHTVRELVPGIEQRWIETYGRVATTGESTRFQMGSDAMGRWFDVFAFRTGRPEERRVALLFTDVSAAQAAARERARLGRELAVERERLAYVFQQAPSFLAVLRGPDHVFTLVNEAYYQLVGTGTSSAGQPSTRSRRCATRGSRSCSTACSPRASRSSGARCRCSCSAHPARRPRSDTSTWPTCRWSRPRTAATPTRLRPPARARAARAATA
jgi:PAS domain-containing protein